jgi:transposase
MDHRRLELHAGNGSARATAGRREQVDQLLAMAEYLAPDDRALIEAIYGRGLSVRQVARAGCVTPGRITRRLRRLMQRLASPTFRLALTDSQDWPAQRRRIAEMALVKGVSLRDTAASVGVSLYRERQELERLRGLAGDAADSPRARSGRS